MTTPRNPAAPNGDALEEPTEGHVAVDGATAWRRDETEDPLQAARETLAALGGAAGGKPAGILTGASFTDHDEPIEDDEDADGVTDDVRLARQQDHGAP